MLKIRNYLGVLTFTKDIKCELEPLEEAKAIFINNNLISIKHRLTTIKTDNDNLILSSKYYFSDCYDQLIIIKVNNNFEVLSVTLPDEYK